MYLADGWIERFVKDQKGLEDAQGSWIAINRKLLELAWNGAFMYGPDPSGAITRTGTGCIAIDELPPEDTALSRLDCTVDFSACVALMVRR